MPSHATVLAGPKEAANLTVKTYEYLLQVLPVTVTVVLEPLIAVLYHLTQSLDAAQRGS